MATFALSPADDLLLPEAGSTTGRAVASYARRTAFEACKAYAGTGAVAPTRAPEGGVAVAIEASEAAARASLAASFDARLPGNPHAISEALRDPRVFGPLALARAGEPGAWPMFVERLRRALGDDPGALPPRQPVEGAVGQLDDPELAAALGLSVHGVGDARAAAAALDALRLVAPALAEDVGRFVPGLVAASGRPRCDTAMVVALPTAAGAGGLEALVLALAGGVVRAKLAIVYADVEQAERTALADEAVAVVAEALHGRLLARGLARAGAQLRAPVPAVHGRLDPRLAPTLAELARLRG